MNYKSNFNVKPCAISSGFVEFERDVIYPELVENGDFSELGSELTTPFSSGWLRIGENNWSLNPAPVNGGIEGIDATSYVYQGISTTIGKQYKVVVDASVTEGSCELRGFNSTTILTISTLGRKTYSAIFTETDGNNNVGFNSASGFTGVIHSLSVKEVGVDWEVLNSDANNYVVFNGSTARLKFLNTSPVTTLESSFLMIAGKTYKLIVDVASVTSGSIKIDGAGISELFNSAGVTTRTITPTSGTRIIFYRATANVDLTLNSVSVTEVGEATESALPNQIECEAYGYTWNSGNRTCQAFNPSITLETIAGNLNNNLYGSNNKTQRGTQNSMTIGQGNSINGITENNLIIGRGNSIQRETANNFIVGTAAKSIVDNSFSLGGNNGVADRLDRLGAQLISNPLFDEVGTELITNGDFLTDTNWSKTNATISNGIATLNIVDGAYSAIYQSVTYTSGKKYRLIATLSGTEGKIMRFQDNASNTGGLTSVNGAVTLTGEIQNIELFFIANKNSIGMNIARQFDGDWQFTFNIISVKEVGQDWTLSANASIEYDKLNLNGSGAFVSAQQSVYASGIKNGKTLRFTYEVTENTLVSGERSEGKLRVGAFSGASLFPAATDLNSSVGTHTFDIVVGIEGTNNVFDMYLTSGYVSGNIKIDYVTLQEVLPFVAPRQMSYLMFGKQTTDGNTKAANLNNTAGTFYVVPLNSASYFHCDIVAVRTGGTSRTGAIGDTASWTERGVFTNLNQGEEGGLTIARERDTVQAIGSGTALWRPTAAVNNTNGNFSLNVRGAADMIIEWAITVRITQIKTTF